MTIMLLLLVGVIVAAYLWALSSRRHGAELDLPLRSWGGVDDPVVTGSAPPEHGDPVRRPAQRPYDCEADERWWEEWWRAR